MGKVKKKKKKKKKNESPTFLSVTQQKLWTFHSGKFCFSKFEDADLHYLNTSHRMVLKLGADKICTLRKLFPNFRVEIVKDTSVTCHVILKNVPQPSNISLHLLNFELYRSIYLPPKESVPFKT